MSLRVPADKFLSFRQLEKLQTTVKRDLKSIKNKSIDPDRMKYLVDAYNTITKQAELYPKASSQLRQYEDASKSLIHEIALSQLKKCDESFDSISKESTFDQFDEAYHKVSRFIGDYSFFTELETCKDYFGGMERDCRRLEQKLKTHLVYPRDFGDEADSSCPYTEIN